MSCVVNVAASEVELAAGRAIRQRVFVDEQGVPPELEIDGLDASCQQFVAYVSNAPAATGRLRATERGVKLERVAVLREYRGRAVGRVLVERMLQAAPERSTVYVHAQTSASGFWERLGFEGDGSSFFEAGIEHRVMIKRASGAEPR